MDRQLDLFGAPPGPEIAGFAWQRDFIDEAEERALIAWIETLPLEAALYQGYRARRRVASFGPQVDDATRRVVPGAPLPAPIAGLAARAAAWLEVAPAELAHALVAEYQPGTPLGWHRDMPPFEAIVGVSLAGSARMRLRRWPHPPGSREAVDVELPPRSVYRLQGEARWGWQHAIPPTPTLRYSITFRTLRRR